MTIIATGLVSDTLPFLEISPFKAKNPLPLGIMKQVKAQSFAS